MFVSGMTCLEPMRSNGEEGEREEERNNEKNIDLLSLCVFLLRVFCPFTPWRPCPLLMRVCICMRVSLITSLTGSSGSSCASFDGNSCRNLCAIGKQIMYKTQFKINSLPDDEASIDN
jgi:hypothetical protein